MKSVGIRDLKARLSAHLRAVGKGGALRVTDRGVPIALLRPLRPGDTDTVAEGTAVVAARKRKRSRIRDGRIGIRELKARLSEILRHVRAGTAIRITDRGRVVAILERIDPARQLPPELADLQDLVDQGLLSPGEPVYDPTILRDPVVHLPEGTAQKILDELREDRC